ncbi:hypothetical protein BpHYR1_016661 [Brachionus plicatilis]|uniref:Uncharacterized protein n=1 Tax=Brachionus plicatilis TaxID=10195 RepID=A0A3M7QD13_BRAPC|nr:hypothetical protein BpHYR1_016661 [Brachionus plicatilis]
MYFVECSVLEIFLPKKNYPYFECISFLSVRIFVATYFTVYNASNILALVGLNSSKFEKIVGFVDTWKL